MYGIAGSAQIIQVLTCSWLPLLGGQTLDQLGCVHVSLTSTSWNVDLVPSLWKSWSPCWWRWWGRHLSNDASLTNPKSFFVHYQIDCGLKVLKALSALAGCHWTTTIPSITFESYSYLWEERRVSFWRASSEGPCSRALFLENLFLMFMNKMWPATYEND